jgi:hypothetical protein
MSDPTCPVPDGVASDSAGATTWSDRYVGLATLLVAICFPAIWVYAGYRGFSFNQSLSFLIDDGWCIKGVESYASHCFGDYSGIDDWLGAGELWAPSSPASAYPAIAWVPAILALRFGQLVGSPVAGRDLFLALLTCSVLAPAIWVSRGSWTRRGPAALLLLGLATAPFLIVIDRGNSVGLVVAPLLGVALTYVRQDYKRMAFLIIVCALLKPQMVILVLLFLFYRKYSYLVATAAGAVGATLAGFLLFPSSFPANIAHWLKVVTQYSGYGTLDSLFPYNLAAGRSVLTILDALQLRAVVGAPARADLVVWLHANNTLLVLALTLAVGSAILLRRNSANPLYPLIAVITLAVISPGISFSYYTALMLVPVALILRDPLPGASGSVRVWSGLLDRETTGSSVAGKFLRWSVIVGLALLLAPLVIPIFRFLPIDTPAPMPGMTLGLLQVLYGPIVLGLLVISVALTVGRLSPRGLKGRLASNARLPTSR